MAEILSKHLPPAKAGVRLLGPAPAPISRIKGKTRWQILLKAPSHAAMAAPLNAVEKILPDLPLMVKAEVDVEPGAML